MLFVLSSCGPTFLEEYSKKDDFHCYIDSTKDNNLRYNFVFNVDTKKDGNFDSFERSSHRNSFKIDDFDEIIKNTKYRSETYRSYLIDGLEIVGWEDENGITINSINPLIINVYDCYENMIIIYPTTRDLIYDIDLVQKSKVNLTLVSYIYPIYEPINTLEIIKFIDQAGFSENEIREIIFDLIYIRARPKGIRFDLWPLKDIIQDFDDLIEYYNDPYFIFLKDFLEIDFEWDRISISFYFKSIYFRYRYQMSSVRNQYGSHEFGLEISHFKNEENFSLKIKNFEGNACTPSLANCQQYIDDWFDRVTWESNLSDASNLKFPRTRNLRKTEELVNLLDEVRATWINIINSIKE